jgi:hypothetical protein
MAIVCIILEKFYGFAHAVAVINYQNSEASNGGRTPIDEGTVDLT